MKGKDWVAARAILASSYAEIESGAGRAAAKKAVFGKLSGAGYADLAEILMIYSAMEGAVAVSDNPTLNFTNSPVGNLNLGSQIGNIKTSLEVVVQQGATGKEFAAAINAIMGAVMAANELSDSQKREA